MNGSAGRPDLDLAGSLAAVASPVRLAILRALDRPRALSEICVGAPAPRSMRRAGSILARQSVKEHLDRLVATGFLVTRPSPTGKGFEYMVDHGRLHELCETLRRALVSPQRAGALSDGASPSISTAT